MKPSLSRAIATLIALTVPGLAWAQTNQASHSVSVQVQAINVLAVTGNVSLTISTATAGSVPDDDTDASARYAFTTNSATNKKITAATDVAVPSGMALKVNLTAPSAGASSGEVTLGTTAANVVTGLSQTRDSNVTITYTATADETASVATTAFTVTYTLTDE